jgi:hypothetical protein
MKLSRKGSCMGKRVRKGRERNMNSGYEGSNGSGCGIASVRSNGCSLE